MNKYNKLFSPMKIGTVEIKNRVVMPAMCLGHGQFDGTPTEQLLDYYEERAKGGVGLIIPGITRVDDVTGLGHFAQLSVSKDSNIEPLKELAQRVHKHGAKIFIQLHHPGYQNVNLLMGIGPMTLGCDKIIPNFKTMFYKMAPIGRSITEKGFCLRTVSPSKVECCDYKGGKNRALKRSEIKAIINKFIEGAYRVKQAGMDGVEIHAAHGYLLNEFLSIRTNKREDEYGGNFENRMRILKEIIEGVRERCGQEFPISVRISADECYEKVGLKGKEKAGYDIEEGVKIAKDLESYGIDCIDVSLGNYETMNSMIEPVSFKEGWRTEYVKRIREAVKIPIIAVNLIRTPEKAEALLQSGEQDFVGIGRGSIADPYWVSKAMEGKEAEIKRCICCLYCFESMFENAFKGSNGQCAVNPAMGHEKEFNNIKKDGAGRTVVIVGAGPSGLMAAEILGRRNFKPIVLEKNKEVGGQLNLANKPPEKEKISWCFQDLEAAVKKYGGEIVKGHEATKESIMAYEPYAVIIATGGAAVKPLMIKGVERDNVCTIEEILKGTINLENKKVAVIGSGLTGLETTEFLLEKGNVISVVEMADTISPVTYEQHKRDILPKLEKQGVEFLPSHKLCEIREGSVVLENLSEGKEKVLKCDKVVLSVGVKSINTLYNELKDHVDNLYKIGDADKVGRIANGTRSAYDLAMNLK